MTKTFFVLNSDIGHWNLFVIWCLVLGAYFKTGKFFLVNLSFRSGENVAHRHEGRVRFNTSWMCSTKTRFISLVT
jgi:hypothetical protein